MDWYSDVKMFHEKFGCAVGTVPAIPSGEETVLRCRLVREEYDELMAAMNEEDLPGIADAVTDLIYVLLGTAVAYGIDIRPVWELVQAANMAKEGGSTRPDGKILKPDGWQSPDVSGEIKRQQTNLCPWCGYTESSSRSRRTGGDVVKCMRCYREIP